MKEQEANEGAGGEEKRNGRMKREIEGERRRRRNAGGVEANEVKTGVASLQR